MGKCQHGLDRRLRERARRPRRDSESACTRSCIQSEDSRRRRGALVVGVTSHGVERPPLAVPIGGQKIVKEPVNGVLLRGTTTPNYGDSEPCIVGAIIRSILRIHPRERTL
jgi:hypothetical protein